MRSKMKLDLDKLSVESFDMGDGSDARGTVEGQVDSMAAMSACGACAPVDPSGVAGATTPCSPCGTCSFCGMSQYRSCGIPCTI